MDNYAKGQAPAALFRPLPVVWLFTPDRIITISSPGAPHCMAKSQHTSLNASPTLYEPRYWFAIFGMDRGYKGLATLTISYY